MFNKIIHIFFSFNNNYIEPVAITFYPLLNKTKSNVFYEMYILHSNITKEKQRLLADIANKRSNTKLAFTNTKVFLIPLGITAVLAPPKLILILLQIQSLDVLLQGLSLNMEELFTPMFM